MEVRWPGGKQSLTTSLLGRFNVDNLLLVWSVLMAWGLPPGRVTQAIQRLLPVPGRMQRLGGNGVPHVVVDYAHTPDAVSKVLTQVRRLAQATQGHVITVLGCGGDRDAAKRPLMAREAQTLSHQFWLTSDNPRSEDPMAIARDMQRGLSEPGASVTVELRRDLAIAQAIAQARAQDWVVIAGKGNEAYQEIQGVRHPFLDASHAQAALRDWRAA
jgi:UDP-N-acetylmuramyl-tripeptide synthetase